MKRVAMFVTNPCTHDARVMKEAATLSENGYEVRVFALANAFNEPGVYPQGNYTVHRLKFDNIFIRAREITWSIASFVLKPLRVLKAAVVWLFKGLVSALLTVLIAVFAIPTLILVKLFPSFAEKKRSRIDIAELNQAGNVRSRTEIIDLRFRLLKASLNLFLRQNMSYHNRRMTQKPLFGSLRVLAGCLWIFVRLSRLLRKIYVRSRAVIRHVYVRTRSESIANVNRLIYKVLLPAHKISTYYYFCKAASKEAEVWSADIAHAHDLNTMYAAYLLKKKSDCKVVYDSHELWIYRNRVGREARLEKFIDKAVEKWLIKHVDAVITVCDSIGDWLEERYPDIPKPVIVRNMPHRLIHREGDAIVGLKSRLGIPENNITMIYTGKITSGRGIEIGVDALAKVDSLHFVLLGYGEQSYVDGLKKKIVDLGVSDRVTFCDPVPHGEVTNFIFGADFALVYIEPVCLSYEYALPNKLFESVQAGVPVLGSSLVEIERIVNGCEIGVCFSDASDLANKVLSECNKVQLDKWRKSIKIAASELCWDKEQSKLVELYERI